MPLDAMSLINSPMAIEHRGHHARAIVYCFEAADNDGLSVHEARITINGQEPLAGVTIVRGEGSVPSETWGPLYRPFAQRIIKTRAVALVGVPYNAWENRDMGEMTVWLQGSNKPKGDTERAAGLRAA